MVKGTHPTFYDHIILHVAHRDHFVNLFDPKPMKNTRPEGLETRVFDASDYLGGFETFVCRIPGHVCVGCTQGT